MKKFGVITMVIFFLAMVSLGGCSSEETGIVDWVKWYFKQKSGIPVYSGTVLTAGVEKPVTIYYDDYGVPHIYAECEWDVAVSYTHLDVYKRQLKGWPGLRWTV